MGAIVQIVTNVTQYVSTTPVYLVGGLSRVVYIAVLALKYISFFMFIVYGIKAMRDRNWMDGVKGAGFVVLGLFIAKYGPNIADFIIGNIL